jgi:hypothetical protein
MAPTDQPRVGRIARRSDSDDDEDPISDSELEDLHGQGGEDVVMSGSSDEGDDSNSAESTGGHRARPRRGVAAGKSYKEPAASGSDAEGAHG